MPVRCITEKERTESSYDGFFEFMPKGIDMLLNFGHHCLRQLVNVADAPQ